MINPENSEFPPEVIGPDTTAAFNIRALACKLAQAERGTYHNPLDERQTNFNALLQTIAKEAFLAGVEYAANREEVAI